MKETYASRVLGLLLAGGVALAGCDKGPPASLPLGEIEATPPASEPAQVTGTAAPQLAPQPLPSVASLTDSVRAAVVNVEVTSRVQGPMGPHGLEDPFGEGLPWPWRQPFQEPREPVLRGAGSGFIIDPSGRVLTNNHVVEGAMDIRVKLLDGRQFDAEVLGTDPLTDVAVLQLQGKDVKDLPVVQLGDSEAMRVGDWVLAIGNPFGLSSSVSLGILSAKARDIQAGPYDDFLQTDAAINPGNSGGPLFNMKGEVIGINTAIVGGGTGIGFAVPSNLVKALVPQLEKEGTVTRGWLGVGVQNLTAPLAEAMNLPVQEGAIVLSVDEGSPAARAGLELDDTIVALDGKPITSASALTRTVALMRPGTEVTLTLYRRGDKQERKLTLGTRPDIEGVSSRRSPRAQEEPHQRIGLGLSDVAPQLQARGFPSGALLTQVVPGSVAERAGLMPGMVVMEAAAKPVRGAADLARILREARPGSSVLLRIEFQGARALRALKIPE
ncbi:Do family serine endopeptidase [Hyalangium minutum]|uniref:HtrA protease/chaperone protein n=1 Tax=Hyalangium minutum TaxID=394096 RepID=A0A085WMD4_9BACT|nr:Do family serine endopeptidase [Hyalangium minutum]KFE68847.1 HtrA protease/chaperone protein [Hyalangium minutum]